MQHGFKRSELELRGPKSDLGIGPGSSRGARSAPFRALNLMATPMSAFCAISGGESDGDDEKRPW
eukprot:2426353-Alexandrium_andersonii.AAC.1